MFEFLFLFFDDLGGKEVDQKDKALFEQEGPVGEELEIFVEGGKVLCGSSDGGRVIACHIPQ